MKATIKIIRTELSVKYVDVDLGDDFTPTDDPQFNRQQVSNFVLSKMSEDPDLRDRNFECISLDDEITVEEWKGKK